MYKQGLTIVEVAQQLNCGKDAVARFLRKTGLPQKRKEQQQKEREALFADYAKGVSVADLAQRYDRTISAVQTLLSKSGKYKPSTDMSKRQYDRKPKIQFEGKLIKNRNQKTQYDDEFVEWCKKTAPLYTVKARFADDLGISLKVLCDIEKENGIVLDFNFQGNPRSPKLVRPYQDRDWLWDKVHVRQMSFDEITKEYGYSRRVLEKWMGIHKVQYKDWYTMQVLTQEQRELIEASLLGDGHITNKKYIPIFIVSHSEIQKDYLYWKYSILANLCNNEPKRKEGGIGYANGKPFVKKPSYRINTRSFSQLEELRDMSIFQLIKGLNPFKFSIYMLDDGYRMPRGKESENSVGSWELCVARMTDKEKSKLLQVLKERFNIIGKINKDIRYIRFGAREAEKIDDIILSNIPNELDIVQYKILTTWQEKSRKEV